MIRSVTTRTVYALRCTVQSGDPVKSRPRTFYATNKAWQDHSELLKFETSNLIFDYFRTLSFDDSNPRATRSRVGSGVGAIRLREVLKDLESGRYTGSPEKHDTFDFHNLSMLNYITGVMKKCLCLDSVS